MERRTGRRPQCRAWRVVMKKAFLWALSMSLATTLHAQITVEQPIPQMANIDVNAASVGAETIPRTIFGTFLEPIGNSTYNGLWAELLQNPRLESGLWIPARVAAMLHDNPELAPAGDLALPLPWEPLDQHQGNRYEVHYGDAANSWQSLRIFGVPGGHTGIKQKVYLPIHRTRDYLGSFNARHLSGDTSITIALHARNQSDALVEQKVEVADSSWTKYPFALQVPEGKLHRLDAADFVVEVAGNERAEVDQFSLMPADAKGGLDPDAVTLAREMNTPLVRFGGNFTSSYHWTDGWGRATSARIPSITPGGFRSITASARMSFWSFAARLARNPRSLSTWAAERRKKPPPGCAMWTSIGLCTPGCCGNWATSYGASGILAIQRAINWPPAPPISARRFMPSIPGRG